MKLYRAFTIFFIFTSIMLISFNCSDTEFNNSLNSSFIPPSTADDVDEKVLLYIHEYVKVTPQSGSPYYYYKQVGMFICACVNSITVLSDTIRTPASRRYENGDTLETQHFRFTKSVNYECQPGCHAAIFYVSGYLNETHFYNNGNSCDNCSGSLYCGSYSDTDEPIYMPQNTTLTVVYGSGSYCDGDSSPYKIPILE